MPDEKFPFSFAKLSGCRIAVPAADTTMYKSSRKQIDNIFKREVVVGLPRSQSFVADVEATTFYLEGKIKQDVWTGDVEEDETIRNQGSHAPTVYLQPFEFDI